MLAFIFLITLFGCDILGACLDGRFHHRVLIRLGQRITNFANIIEHESDGARLAHVSTILGERSPNLGGSTVFIVGGDFHDDANASRSETFVTNIFESIRIPAGCLVDRSLDIVLGHGLPLGIGNGEAQARIGIRIGPTQFCSNRDLLGEAREQLGTHGVLTTFTVLDIRPLGVSGHFWKSFVYESLPLFTGSQIFWLEAPPAGL